MMNKGRFQRNTSGTIENFLRGCFVTGQCERIELRQLMLQGTVIVNSWIITEYDEIERSPESLAAKIDEVAKEDAAALRGPTRYGVFVYRKDDDKHYARVILLYQGDLSGDAEDAIAETEPANANGLVAQSQRHTEFAMRTMVNGFGLLMGHFQRTMIAQESTIARYEKDMQAIFDMNRKLSLDTKQADLEAKEAERSAAHKDRLLDKLDMFVPALASKILPAGSQGKGVAMVETMRAFMGSLQPHQLNAIVETLDETQKIAVMTAYQTFLEEEKAKEERKKKESEKKEDEGKEAAE